jgi:hypothetical protein
MDRAPVLHITNGESTRFGLEPSGVPGVIRSWDDVLYEGRIPLATGDAWVRERAAQLAAAGHGSEEEMLARMRATADPLDAAGEHDEVVFWLEHDLHDQLLLMRHLWWLSRPSTPQTRYSIVIGTDYLGLLKPEQFPSRFAARRPITDEEIRCGAGAWETYGGDDPGMLQRFSNTPALPYLPKALRRLLEELPATGTGLARSERQILGVLAEGTRSPEQLFVAASRLEDDIWMGDLPFWSIVRRLAAGPEPLVALDVRESRGRLPSGTAAITGAGRQVLAGGADHIELNAPSRWFGGTRLSPERDWRWTGSSVQRPSP